MLTSWIGLAVGANGRVVAVDAHVEQLKMARANAERAGAKNIEFARAQLGAEDLPFKDFDVVHCRLLLMHLPDADRALGAMARAVRPGGLLACEESSAASVFTSPRCEPIERMNELFRALGRGRGLDFDIGDKLFGLVGKHTSRLVASRFIQPMLPLESAVKFLTLAAVEMKPALLTSGLATEQQANEIMDALRNFQADQSAYYAPGRLAQVAGIVG